MLMDNATDSRTMNGSRRDTALDVDALERSLDHFKHDVDVMYLFFAGNIVMFMQAGFAFLECGVIRSKNTTNILIKNLLDLFISGIAFWLTGYAIAMGEGNTFMGWSKFASVGVSDQEMATWFFQYVFASTASTIVSGAVAERCDFIAYLLYSAVISGVVYPFLVHWAWNAEGWLKIGDGVYHYQDFAGGGVVHMCGGICSLVAAYVLGPRIGRFNPVTKKVVEMPGHSMPFAALGGFILVAGFVAFNGGSQGHISEPGDGAVVAVIVANTMIAGSFGALTGLLIHKSGIFGTPKQWSFLYSLNGSLIAMVATCPGGDRFYPWVCPILGIVGAFWFFIIVKTLHRLQIDDPLDVVAVHFGGGTWGLVAGGLFTRNRSVLYNGEWLWLAWNMIGMVAILSWSAGISAILFGFLNYLKIFRVSEEMERRGLDILKHGEPAYPVAGWQEEQYSCFTISAPEGQTQMQQLGLPPVMLTSMKRGKVQQSAENGSRVNNGFVPEISTPM